MGLGRGEALLLALPALCRAIDAIDATRSIDTGKNHSRFFCIHLQQFLKTDSVMVSWFAQCRANLRENQDFTAPPSTRRLLDSTDFRTGADAPKRSLLMRQPWASTKAQNSSRCSSADLPDLAKASWTKGTKYLRRRAVVRFCETRRGRRRRDNVTASARHRKR